MKYKINECNYDIKKFIKENICEEFKIDYWDDWLDKQDYNSLQIKPNILVSAEIENNLVGTCSIKIINNKECYLNSFYVKKEYRNRGIGNKLFNLCMDYAKESNCKKITLSVDPKFTIAKAFYEKRGFIFDYYDEQRQELNYYKYIESRDKND